MGTMIRIAFFSTLAFTVILFLMGWLELGDITSSFINQFTYFLLILVMNFISLFVIYQLYDSNMRGIKLTFYAFFSGINFGFSTDDD